MSEFKPTKIRPAVMNVMHEKVYFRILEGIPRNAVLHHAAFILYDSDCGYLNYDEALTELTEAYDEMIRRVAHSMSMNCHTKESGRFANMAKVKRETGWSPSSGEMMPVPNIH